MRTAAERCLLAAWLLLAGCTPVSAQEWAALDGDTLIRHADGMRVRIVGMDSPELGSHARCDREALLAERARLRMAELMISGDVTMEWRGLDRYRRQLAIVRVDGRDVAAVMIAEGLARRYDGRTQRQGWC